MDTQIITTIAVFAMATPMSFAVDVPTQASTQESTQVEPKKEGFTAQSSKDLIGEKKLAWITEMRSKLPIVHREIGPFGMAQDPTTKLAKPTQQKRKPGAFLNAIAAIHVNAVIPSENKFVIASREFREGEALPLIRADRQFNIKIIAVKYDCITFENVDTGERVKRNLIILPRGMKRNAPIDSVPGVVPANKKDETPLNLDRIDVHTTQQH
jgi:hypothetical protein